MHISVGEAGLQCGCRGGADVSVGFVDNSAGIITLQDFTSRGYITPDDHYDVPSSIRWRIASLVSSGRVPLRTVDPIM